MSNLKVGQIVLLKEFSIKNNVGGTSLIEKKDIRKGKMIARITKTWYDYETGEHAEGELIDGTVIKEVIRNVGMEYTPKHYKQYGEEIYNRALEAWDNYEPSRVFFSQFDIEETIQ